MTRRKKDLTGQRFGQLEAIKPTNKRAKDKTVIWLCLCHECGKYCEISLSHLGAGQKSCGCMVKKVLHENGIKVAQYNIDKYIKEDTNVKSYTMHQLKSNTSGFKGVMWDKKRGKWIAKIIFKREQIFLGRYDDILDAAKARKQAEEKYFKPIHDKYSSDF